MGPVFRRATISGTVQTRKKYLIDGTTPIYLFTMGYLCDNCCGNKDTSLISKSTGRVVKNDGKKQFLKKWGIKQSTLHKYYLKRGEPYQGELKEPLSSLGLIFQKGIAAIKNL